MLARHMMRTTVSYQHPVHSTHFVMKINKLSQSKFSKGTCIFTETSWTQLLSLRSETAMQAIGDRVPSILLNRTLKIRYAAWTNSANGMTKCQWVQKSGATLRQSRQVANRQTVYANRDLSNANKCTFIHTYESTSPFLHASATITPIDVVLSVHHTITQESQHGTAQHHLHPTSRTSNSFDENSPPNADC